MNVLQDIRFSLRILLKSPWFTVVAMVTLGLGIGANSFMFTVYNAAIFKTLPFEKPRQIVDISYRERAARQGGIGIPYSEFDEYRQHVGSFTGIAGMVDVGFNISDEHTVPERVNGTRMTANTFSVIGQKPILGRDFKPDDERAESDPVAILSYALWQTRYAGDSSIIGKQLRINDRYHTIVGIMSEAMQFPETSRMWMPLVLTPQERQMHLDVVGRLRDGVLIGQAEAELRLLRSNILAERPEINPDLEPVVALYTDRLLDREDKQLLTTLLGSVTFVLLIACANVANLLLARAVYRSRETSIRIAVGASRWRIVRQLLIESVLLSFLGGIFGLGFAVAAVRIFAIAIQPLGVPYWVDWSMDMTVFLYLFAICFAAGILFGLAPALQISRTNVHDGLKETGRSSTRGVKSRGLVSVLIVGEIALTLVLMVGGGLMIRSMIKRQGVDVGVKTENLIAMQLTLDVGKYPDGDTRYAFEHRLVERLQSERDIESFTVASHVPGGGAMGRALKLEDRDISGRDGAFPAVNVVVVEPGYFKSLGLSMPRGREFTPLDGTRGAEAAIVNQRFAAEYWPGEDSIGKRIHLDSSDGWMQVVGISPTVRQTNLRQQQPEAIAYIPFRQFSLTNFRILVRTRSPKEVVARRLREVIRDIDSELPLFNIVTMQEFKNRLLLETRILSTLFSVFAVIALVLSSVGIYAVTAYSTSQRTQEIGVRMALGARANDVVWLVLGLGLKQLAIGLPLGILGAYGMSQLIAGVLFQVTPWDLATFISIPTLLATIVLCACLIPGRRAGRINPVEALRH
jgi:putative ABC transport system permease protein